MRDRHEKFHPEAPAANAADATAGLVHYFYAVCQNPRRLYRWQYYPDRRPRCGAEGDLWPRPAAVHPLSPLAGTASARRFRFSLQYQIPVSQLLNQYIWNSFLLASVALVFYWGIGLAVGVVSALRPGSWFDHLVSVAVFAAMSFPTFFLCLLLIKWFAVDLHWLPVGGMTNTGSDESGWQYVLQVAAHLALPVLALVMLQAGSLTRYVRASMLDVVKMDFIRTARAKGLHERTVILKHALRNALLPIITLLGFELPGLFSGAIITEKVFNWPGAGHIHIDSLAARDYPVLMGFTLFLAVLTIVGNLLADVLYAWADPRIRVRS